MSACGGSGLGVLREKAVRHESRTTSAPAVRQIISKNFGIHVSYGMTMKQILTTALAAWLAGNLAAGAVEELPALPVPPQDAPGGAAFANENIVHDDGTGAQISFFLPTHDKRGSLEVEYTSYNIIVVKNGRFLLLEDLSGSKTEDGKAFFGKIIIPSEFIDSAEIGMWGSPRNSSLGIEKKLKVSTFKKILREKSWTDQKSATEGGTIRLESNRDAATAISRIRAVIKADLTFDKLSEILGEPDMDIGSGIHIFVYRLSDGTGIRVGTPDKKAQSIRDTSSTSCTLCGPAGCTQDSQWSSCGRLPLRHRSARRSWLVNTRGASENCPSPQRKAAQSGWNRNPPRQHHAIYFQAKHPANKATRATDDNR